MSNQGINSKLFSTDGSPSIESFYGPYTTLEEALNSIPSPFRQIGRKIGLKVGNKVIDFKLGNFDDSSSTARDNITTGNFVIVGVAPESLIAPAILVALDNSESIGKYKNGDIIPEQPTVQLQLKDIAQKTLNPTLVAPTFSVSLSDTAIKEVGSAYSATMTGNFNQGQILGDIDNGVWNPNLEQNKRAGSATSYDLDGTNQAGNSKVVTRTIILGNNTFNGAVNYSQGVQPLDSVGGDFNSPLPSGSLSNSASVPGRYYRFIYLGSRNTHPTTSSLIRSLSKSFLDSNNNSSFSVSIPANTSEVVIYTISGKSVSAQNPATNEVFTPVQTSIIVKDADGVDTNYTKNIIDLGLNGFPDDATFNVTIN